MLSYPTGGTFMCQVRIICADGPSNSIQYREWKRHQKTHIEWNVHIFTWNGYGKLHWLRQTKNAVLDEQENTIRIHLKFKIMYWINNYSIELHEFSRNDSTCRNYSTCSNERTLIITLMSVFRDGEIAVITRTQTYAQITADGMCVWQFAGLF